MMQDKCSKVTPYYSTFETTAFRRKLTSAVIQHLGVANGSYHLIRDSL